MAGKTIPIQLEGDPADDGHVRLTDFIQQLEAVANALKHTERLISHSEERSLNYRIVDLSHSSPATVVIEAIPQKPDADVSDRTVKRFLTTMRMIEKKGRVPHDIDLDALQAYRQLGSVLDKHVSELSFKNGKRQISIDKEFKHKVDHIIGPDELVEGSICGTLEWLNIHNTNRFNIYPTVGPAKVVCDFPHRIREKVKLGIDRYVRVFGKLRYKKRDDFPYGMIVDDLDTLPPENELPTLDDLRGIAPDATGNQTAEEFVESLRYGNQ